MDSSEIKHREETKRDAAYDPVQRWRHIQDTITWAEANLPYEQRRNRPRVANHGASPKPVAAPAEHSDPGATPESNPNPA